MCHLEHRHNDWKKQGDSRNHEAEESENTLCKVEGRLSKGDRRRLAVKIKRSVREIPEEEEIILGADLNCHVGETAGGYEACHGGFGYGLRNEEGEEMLETLESLELVLVNTGFKKRDEHLTSYRSGDSSSQIDFLVVRKRTRKNVRDAKMIPGEAVAHQYR
ncbi:uncharacterized protein LOC134772335 [Penaeus indicus]|uniref:uncharacterized protein LOC134772335 n=1 Tax=Penaeus indicus TaxID=29960 RepID=UPI00300D73F5